MRERQVRVPARVAVAKWTQSQSESWGVYINFEFVEPEKDYLENGLAALDHVIWITPRAADMAAKNLKTLGFDVDTASPDRKAQFRENPEPFLLNAECVLVCALEAPNAYHRDSRWKVKWINAPGAETGAPASDPLRVLAERPRKGDGQAGLPLTDSPATGPAAYDEDVPF